MHNNIRSAIDPLWLAQCRLRRGRYDDCIETCTLLLEQNRLDTAAWFLKCRALSLKTWVNDLDIEEEVRFLPRHAL